MSAKICFICNIASEHCQINLAQIKSQHSRHPLLIFITKFLRKASLNRSLYNTDNCICENCLSRVNEYDSICVKAKRIEDELHKMLLKSDKSWHTTIEDDHSAEDIQDNRNDVGEIVSESSRDHESEVNQHSELIPKKVFECTICKQIFHYEAYYIRHVDLHERDEKEPLFRCTVCLVVCRDQDDFDNHSNLHKEVSPLQCIHCRRNFMQRGHLAKHMLSHTEKTNYQCDICGKMATRKAGLISHMKAHSDCRDEICHICSRPFKNKAHLRNHLRTHTGEKPFSCNVCNKAFSNRYNRDVHQKLHEGGTSVINIHKCALCTSAFARKAKLKEHMEKNHATVMPHAAIENRLESSEVDDRSHGDFMSYA